MRCAFCRVIMEPFSFFDEEKQRTRYLWTCWKCSTKWDERGIWTSEIVRDGDNKGRLRSVKVSVLF